MDGMFFFVKRRTAFVMRISDWSSDVFSSDLSIGAHAMNGQTQEVVFQNVSKIFGKLGEGEGGFTAVDDLSFTVGKGEMVAVLGKTGCGKSTMFGLLAGLLAPSAGTILVDGHNPFAEFEWFRGKIGKIGRAHV